MKLFGDFHKVVGQPNQREALQHAVVERGAMVATDGHVLTVVDIRLWLDVHDKYDNPDGLQRLEYQLKNVEGKCFHRDLLKKMALTKWKELYFDEYGVTFIDKKDKEEFEHYSGEAVQLLDNGTVDYKMWEAGEEEGDIKISEERFWRYPNWRAIMPNRADSFPMEKFGVDTSLIMIASNCFNSSSDSMKFTLTGLHKAIMVDPLDASDCINPRSRQCEQYGIVMPVMLK